MIYIELFVPIIYSRLLACFFIKTKTAKIDGLLSICNGFKKHELLTYSEQMPSFKHTIKWKWAFRYLWVIQPNQLNETNE